MKNSLRIHFWVVAMIAASNTFAQESTLNLSSFNKITVSPRIHLILQKGEKEAVRFICNDIPKEKVNVKVHGNKLKIFLDHARIVEKQARIHENGNSRKQGIYAGASVTAYVTYRELKSVAIRGESELRCDDELSAAKFKLKAYGENEIRLASLQTKKFKSSLYGENDLKINSGQTNRQVYRLFGENKIDTHNFISETASTRIYGEGKIRVNASNEVRITAFGEPSVIIDGTSFVSKGIILGHADIRVTK